MGLILKAISYKGVLPEQDITAHFDEQGGSIGRAPDNHLVLPDPEKVISRLHATIFYQGGKYFIQDSSTGGTYLAMKGMLLQKNQSPLENGEILRIGDYEFQAIITDHVPVAFKSVLEPVRQLELAEQSLLDSPFSATNKPEDHADFYNSFIEQPESSAFHQSFTAPKVDESTKTDGDGDDMDFSDLLSTLDKLPNANNFTRSDLPTLPDDFFVEESTEHESPFQSEITPIVKADLSASAMGAVDSNLPGLSLEADAINSPTETRVFAPVGSDIHEFPPITELPFSESNTRSENQRLTSNLRQVVDQRIQPEQHTVNATDSELLRVFLQGAGIADPNFIPPEQWSALMKTSGELLRSMVDGLMQVLRARAELKSQFRVSVTTMRSIDNNPLKFTPNVDDAIKLILLPTNPGFLSPKEAVYEGFRDIMNHQMAMTAGIQAALAEILRSFDPEMLEKSQGEGILFQKKAKCWEYYIDKYPQLKALAQEDFFGETFAKAYEKQMLLLSRSSKKQ